MLHPMLAWLYTRDEHLRIREQFSQGFSSLSEHVTLFFGLEPINIFACHTDHSSLKLLQHHFLTSKDFPKLKPQWVYALT